MKKPIIYLAMMSLAVSVTFGAFTYYVDDIYLDFELELNNQSVLVEGAGIKEVDTVGSSYVEVRDTDPMSSTFGGVKKVTLRDTSSMKVYGGEVGNIIMQNTSTFDVLGGEIYDLFDSTTTPGGMINVSDGYIHQFRVSGSSTSTFSGGQLDEVSFLNIGDGLSVTFVCNLDTLNLTYDNENLINATAEWLDGSTFNTDFSIGVYDEYVHFVPEPATLALLGLGGLLLRRKK